MQGVSVVIACYKAGDYLREAVQSVHAAAPSGLPYEIIVVDDCSPDKETAFALNALSATDDKIRILEQPENRGQSAARNRAMESARYDYILPLDADDKLKPGQSYMAEAVAVLRDRPDAVLAYCKGELFGSRSGSFLLPGYDEKRMLIDNMIPVYGMFRRGEALDAGGYAEHVRFTEDWELWNALHNRRFNEGRDRTVVQLDQRAYLYRQYAQGDNVSVKQRLPMRDHFANLAGRAQDLYEHHYGTADPAALAKIREQTITPLRQVFLRAMNAKPAEFAHFVIDWGLRKYPQWRRQQKLEA